MSNNVPYNISGQWQDYKPEDFATPMNAAFISNGYLTGSPLNPFVYARHGRELMG